MINKTDKLKDTKI